MYLIFDTETTGLPRNYNAPMSDLDNWPRLVQLAWQLHDEKGKLISNNNYIVKPEGFTIPYNSEKIHGISTQRALKEGHDLKKVLEIFEEDLKKTTFLVGHNIGFDISIVGAELLRTERPIVDLEKQALDTKDISTEFCAIPGGKGGKFKWPTLFELHQKLFGEGFGDAHDAAYDVDATAKCFFGLIKEGVQPPIEGITLDEIIYEPPNLEAANFAAAKDEVKVSAQKILKAADRADISDLKDTPFTHLHVHTQFSILQSTSEIPAIIRRAKELGMPALAMTDHGNMMGAFNFVKEAFNNDIKPILGCEFNLCRDRKNKSNKDDGYQTVLLAKNKAGYHNLAKLASYANIEGFYYVPRIDREVLVQYKGDLIATTGGLWGEVPYLILNVGETQAEEAFVWWHEQFGDNFYIELNRHGIPEEEKVNEVLLQWAAKYNVKYFAANNTYYNAQEDAKSHDILLCVKDGELVEKPKKYIGKRGREYRYGFPNDEFYLKSPEEMKKLFADLPEAISCTDEIVSKIEPFKLAREVLLPKYDIPEKFVDPKDDEDGGKRGENAFLRHLTYEGAKKRYGEITDEIRERLDFELETIERTGYPGYFLIVQDFTGAAREMGVSVGPGRGSAAGSAVAYCVGITNVDPIAYDLLFERFLNPDRVSLPDIDIDFDDEGRQRVIEYVIKKYGANQVAQIITYGTMAAKSAIRDTARVLNLPLSEADRLAKLVTDIKLKALFELANDRAKLSAKLKNNNDNLEKALELIRISKGNDDNSKTINQAKVLEGSVRNTGIHACGVIITPDDITNFVPVALAKDSEMVCTQFDNSVVESAGLLKMDFLGLKTLTLIKDAVRIIKERHGIELDPENFPIDDVKTYELFQRGETVGIFQYESAGMQKYMRELKPTVFADLIAMNALYRPGPLEYIPSFIKRKHGLETITYDLDDMKEYLEETYGITVYQEQVMLLSQKLADFTKGEADVLRKAMGKKQKNVLDEMKPKFINQAAAKGHDSKKLEKIWKDWEAFASYAFNKSHSTCYAWIAYQTAYLKAHYPAEYMASVLSNNMNDITQVTFFMEECKRMGIQVLGPDVNESKSDFTVNMEGQIRFGLAAIKGAGNAAVNAIIEEREAGGLYKDVFTFTKRVNLKAVNKKTMEVLAMAGGFDCFVDFHRRQYLEAPDNEATLLEKAIKYAQKVIQEEESSQVSMFGGGGGLDIPVPSIPNMEPFSQLQQLNIEKEVVGLYISGHPLDQFKVEIEAFTNTGLPELADLSQLKSKGEIKLAGAVTSFAHRTTKNGKPFGTLTMEDYHGGHTFFLFGEDYVKFKEYFMHNWFLYISGSVHPNKYKPAEFEFKINQITLLNEIRGKMIKGLRVHIDLDDLGLELMEKLEAITQKYKGDAKLYINIIDNKENLTLDLISAKYRIDPSNELIQALDQIPEVAYKIL
ncbi:DNA polymerase III subunit alpha [Cyclobacterium marinum]|uniref:DNA polymerase III subunit alpha n=1 Tax=Cyclobacterium marinum (strain ATCC 25205 / DSM 745 / LMG 13164 / NCIMB 1802) TaxID=880070 RepID=G0J148_CYCMS|nr:DNA polymerase III subunit alpha [Cyclobacterium marinum]AEL25797.1 DNA polymerase III, alpha subunit [Cyclobacterium marinum DSM 745]